jgi:hypothetical protein
MRRPTPTQAQLLARSREETRLAHKKRYRGLIGLGLGAAGLAAALAGLPFLVTLALWGLGVASWMILKAV